MHDSRSYIVTDELKTEFSSHIIHPLSHNPTLFFQRLPMCVKKNRIFIVVYLCIKVQLKRLEEVPKIGINCTQFSFGVIHELLI